MAESFSPGPQDHKVLPVKNQAVLQVSGRWHASAMLWAPYIIPPSHLWCYHLLYLFQVLDQEGLFNTLVAPQMPHPLCRKQTLEHSHFPASSRAIILPCLDLQEEGSDGARAGAVPGLLDRDRAACACLQL